jgi:hypothetical protein
MWYFILGMSVCLDVMEVPVTDFQATSWQHPLRCLLGRGFRLAPPPPSSCSVVGSCGSTATELLSTATLPLYICSVAAAVRMPLSGCTVSRQLARATWGTGSCGLPSGTLSFPLPLLFVVLRLDTPPSKTHACHWFRWGLIPPGEN